MTFKKYIIPLFVFVFTLSGYAQIATLKKATKDYDKFSYVKTSNVLLEVANKGYKSADLFQKLGNAFYFNNKMKDAVKWYGELMSLDQNVDSEYLYRYAQALKAIENYEESDKWMQKFANAKSDDKRSKSFSTQRGYLKSIERLSEDFQVENMDINTSVSDFGSNQYKNQLIFSSSRGSGKNYKWNNQPYLDLYTVTKQDDGNYSGVELFDGTINTKFHESTVSFLPTDDVMYFTRNNFFKKRLKRDEEGVNRLQLYRARLQEDNSWGEVKSIHFNSESYSVAHPTVNAQGTKLYFASDMPGEAIGQSDLFVVDINEDGSLGEPESLGVNINTEGQETFPYINSKGDLYFSSNGFTGLGGLDVYLVRNFEEKFESKKAFTIENLGRPINSSKDDFAYYENLGTMEGFFTSNREGGKGDDDIYSFKVPECIQDVEGIVYDKKTNQILAEATVTIFDFEGNQIAEMLSDDNGAYAFINAVKCEKEYLIRAEKEMYLTNETRISGSDNRKEIITQDLYIEADEVAIAAGTNLREALNLNPIYFDFDKANIRPDAEIELQKVIAVLKQYPNMKIDVKSHTDSRATTAYNDALSSKRNRSTIKYIIEAGNISKDRLTGKGYGERELVNKCADGVPCTKEEHQLNRRSDFIVIAN